MSHEPGNGSDCAGDFCARGVVLAAHSRQIDHHEALLEKLDGSIGRVLAECEATLEASTNASVESQRSRLASEQAETHARACMASLDRAIAAYQIKVPSDPPRAQQISIMEDEISETMKLQGGKGAEIVWHRMKRAEAKVNAATLKMWISIGVTILAGLFALAKQMGWLK